MSYKYGDTEYFCLLVLRHKLGDRNYNNLGLTHLDSLRHELNVKINELEEEFKLNKKQK